MNLPEFNLYLESYDDIEDFKEILEKIEQIER